VGCGWDKKAERLRLAEIARLSEKDFICYYSLDRNVSHSHSDMSEALLAKNRRHQTICRQKTENTQNESRFVHPFFNVQPLLWRI